MDPKYYSLVEIIVFGVFAFGFCIYQIWSVRRKSDDDRPRSDSSKRPKADELK